MLQYKVQLPPRSPEMPSAEMNWLSTYCIAVMDVFRRKMAHFVALTLLLLRAAASYAGRGGHSGDYIAIRQTLNRYALALDSKDFGALDLVFTVDVVADYGRGVGVLNGLQAVETGLMASLAPVTTQHALTTQVIDLAADGGTANSTTYYTASHFGKGAYQGQVVRYIPRLFLTSSLRFPD